MSAPESSPAVRVARAEATDIPAVVHAVSALLAELTGDPSVQAPAGAARVCQRVISGEIAGAIFLAHPAERRDQLIGVLTMSVQEAVHIGGPYALIQDLWVHPDWRSQRVGAALLVAAQAHCQAAGLSNIEVCLPGPSFPGFPDTYRFYKRCGFFEVGPRLRTSAAYLGKRLNA